MATSPFFPVTAFGFDIFFGSNSNSPPPPPTGKKSNLYSTNAKGKLELAEEFCLDKIDDGGKGDEEEEVAVCPCLRCEF